MSFKPGLIGRHLGEDPLDKLMVALGAVTGLSAVGAAMGYGAPILAALGVLGTVAYAKAPARTFPTAESVADGVDLSGKVAIVTGPTSGIGTETARVLALRGAHVVLAARSEVKLAATKTELEEKLAKVGVKARLTAIAMDLSDLESVKSFVSQFKALNLSLNLLITNAGVMALRERRPTSQGLEQQVGINHVGHTYLTMLLMPTLQASSSSDFESRVVCLSSTAYRFASPGFFEPKNAGLETTPYDPWVAYGNAKLGNMLFARELHKRFASAKDGAVQACSVMPGGIHTGLQGEVPLWTAIKWRVVTPFFFKSVAQGAATTIHAALIADLSDTKQGGQYFNDCKTTKVASKMPDEAGSWLWEATEKKLADLGFPLLKAAL